MLVGQDQAQPKAACLGERASKIDGEVYNVVELVEVPLDRVALIFGESDVGEGGHDEGADQCGGFRTEQYLS